MHVSCEASELLRGGVEFLREIALVLDVIDLKEVE